jgi:AsmA protein
MKVLKWILIIGGILVVLVIVALLAIPMFVDINKYKPEIEKKVTEATGRPFSIGSDLDLSLFPFAGVRFSDLQLGNPPGFKDKEFVNIKLFEVRVKLLPLISKDIQVKRFIVKGPRIVLVKNKDGKANWEFSRDSAPKDKPDQKQRPPEREQGEFPIKKLTVGEFAITDGFLLYVDQTAGTRQEITDLNILLENVSLDRPMQMAFSAQLDQKPIKLKGSIGPVGKDPGRGTIPFDLVAGYLQELELKIKGSIRNPAEDLNFAVNIKVPPFSPRKLSAELGLEFPIATADPQSISRVAFDGEVKGNADRVNITDGVLTLDDSTLNFTASAKEFSKPNVAFDLNLDQIDLDRYLPPEAEDEGAKKKGETPTGKKGETLAGKKDKTDYAPLRRLIMDGALKIGKLKLNNARAQEIRMKVAAKNGIFTLKHLSMKFYQGTVNGNGVLNVTKDTPVVSMELLAETVQVGPLLKDVLDKEILEGVTHAKIVSRFAGDDPDTVKKTLNSKGELLFQDGAIVGIDIPGMVRNVGAAFGLAEKSGKKPRTDFSELKVPYTIENGRFKTTETRLMSPLIRILAAGKADLINETLDFRVEPKLVATLKGQGGGVERSGIMVPVLVSGSFSSPEFKPDLTGITKQQIKEQVLESKEVKKILEKEELKPFRKQLKGLFNSLGAP